MMEVKYNGQWHKVRYISKTAEGKHTKYELMNHIWVSIEEVEGIKPKKNENRKPERKGLIQRIKHFFQAV